MNKIRTNIYRRFYRDGRPVWMVRWWDEKTRSWKAVKGGDTRDEAQLAESQLRLDLIKGINPVLTRNQLVQNNETISNLIDLYCKSPKFLNNSPRWRECLKCQMDGPIKEQLGNLKCVEIKRDRILAFYMALKAKGLSHATVRRYHLTLSQLFDLFVEKYPESQNPFRAIKDFKKIFPKQASTRDINFLIPQEIDTLLAEVKRSKSRLLFNLVQFLAYSGLRRSEALNLKWTDIDEKAGFIYIRNSKNRESRTIPLEPKAREAISSLNRKTTFVFTKANGKQFYEGSFLKPLQRAAVRAGIQKRVDLHTLRHSWGSNKIRQGWGLKKVSLMLGHKTITMTSQVYTHLLDGDLKVRDDFHFDNSNRIENSERQAMDQNQLDPQTILCMIQTLQAQLVSSLTSHKGQEVGGVAPQTVIDSESSRNFNTDSTKTSQKHQLCYSNATGMKANKKAETPKSSAQNKISNNFNRLNLKKMATPPGIEPGTLSLEG